MISNGNNFYFSTKHHADFTLLQAKTGQTTVANLYMTHGVPCDYRTQATYQLENVPLTIKRFSFKCRETVNSLITNDEHSDVVLRPVHTSEVTAAARSCNTLPEQSSLVCLTISSEKICCATQLLLPSFAPSYIAPGASTEICKY